MRSLVPERGHSMTTRQICLLLALAGPMAVSGCKKDDAPPAIDSGTPSKADTSSTPDVYVSNCISIADDLIADFKTNNGLNPADGRQGGFYVYGDSSGTFDPVNDTTKSYPIDSTGGTPACSGPGSFHTKATGFNQWGAAMGADLMPKTDSGAKGTYDASKYVGISFWAKASAPLSGVQVSFPDIYTDAAADPKSLDPSNYLCAYQKGAANNCSPYLVKFGDALFGSTIQNYKIDTEWKRFDILFADTQQDQYNPPGSVVGKPKLEVAHLTAMAIQVNATYVGGNPTANDFELWIDDVNFIK